RTAATREALVGAARPLFAQHGYAAVSTDQIARAAGVTRGALYHQFAGKEELFAALLEQMEAEIADRLAARLGSVDDPLALLRDGIDGWLEACAQPEVRRIVLIEAPAALGWQRWREVGRRYGVGLVEATLQLLVDGEVIADQPVRPLAHVLIGALEEAALYVAGAADREEATAEVRASLLRLVEGLLLRT
ncbi:MAG: TetR family transcriptional regulator, partial [Actinomycetota bacterium]|nr:TetR family transcriptional regulator [Actinomycetota bacterium]